MRDLPAPFTGKKLVIWDLDDTLWTGVLSEGGINRRPHCERLLRALAMAGLVNSVASNNDEDVALRELEHLGLSPFLVFPAIGWEPKSALVGRVLEQTQLRASEAILVDDHPRLRHQIEQEQGVTAVDPQVIAGFRAADVPVLDPALEVVRRYRVLERRRSAQAAAAGDEAAFLRGCDVVVTIETPAAHSGRIVELVRRAHQLNFTKRPLDAGVLEVLCADPTIATGAVRVTDRYGDYGVAGFFAVDRNARRLLHFVFSCRLLHMGVEQFLYRHLGSPVVDVRAPVASDLAAPLAPDWIRLGDRRPPPAGGYQRAAGRLLLKGGCDMELVMGYLGAPDGVDTRAEVLTVEDGVQRYGHSALNVLLAVGASTGGEVLDRIPWLQGWETELFSGDPTAVVLSLWVDYACLTYRHRQSGLRVPAYAHLVEESDERLWQQWWGRDTEHRDWFLREFEPAPALTPSEVVRALGRLRQLVPAQTRILVLNAAEVHTPWRYAWGELQHTRHRVLNAKIDRALGGLGVELVDLRPLVTSPADLHEGNDVSLTHYARHVYLAMARTIDAMAGRSLLELPSLADPAWRSGRSGGGGGWRWGR